MRDLLGHTAGTRDPEGAFIERMLRRRRGRVDEADMIAAAPRPGARTSAAEYSNIGFNILGAIERRAGGRPVAEQMREELFGVVGGDGLALQPTEQPSAPLAHNYRYPRGYGNPVDVHDGSAYVPARFWVMFAGTAGALAGDVPSLARWGHELFTGDVLTRASLREMTRFHDHASWDGYGLGLALERTADDRPMWGHTGDGLGSHTEFWHLPRERLTIAVTWNDDVLDREGGILPALLNAALGTGR